MISRLEAPSCSIKISCRSAGRQNDEVIYNWGNQDLSMAKLDKDGALSNFAKLASITNDSNEPTSTVPPVSMNDEIIFSHEQRSLCGKSRHERSETLHLDWRSSKNTSRPV